MICIHPVSAFTLFLYVYIWIPLYQTARVVFGFFSFLLDPHRQLKTARFEENPGSWELDLPASRFQDLELRSEKEEEVCSICLMEFEKDDMVNKLPKCGHVVHGEMAGQVSIHLPALPVSGAAAAFHRRSTMQNWGGVSVLYQSGP